MKRVFLFISFIVAINGMAQVPISALPTHIGNASLGYVPVVISGQTRKATGNQLAWNKVDSVNQSNDSLFSWKNGVKTFVGKIKGILGLQDVTNVNGETLDTIYVKGLATNNIMINTDPEPEYEIVVFPDLQNMVPGGLPTRNAAGRSMFTWVRDSADDYNVKAVIGVGDMTEEGNNDPEWDTLNVWYAMLNTINIPYMTPPGNHDYNNRFTMFSTGRDLTKYNTHFGASRYASKPFFVDVFRPNKFENSLYKFDAGSRKYAVFVMEFFPTDSAMNWVSAKCDSLLLADPERQVILTTHAYIRQQGERSTDDSPSSVNAYSAGAGGVGADNSGDEIWDKLGKKKKNIRFIFAGHFIKNGVHVGTGFTHRIVSTGENGNVVDQIYVNYQDASDYGNGYMMRLRFAPTTGKVTVSFWSRYEAQFDPLYPSYVIDDPVISVSSSMGIAKTLTVFEQLRADGRVKFPNLVRGRLTYTGYDGEQLATDQMRWTLDDSLALLVGLPTYEAGWKVQVSGGIKADRAKLSNLTALRFPFPSANGVLRDTALFRWSTDTARVIIGNGTDNAISRLQVDGGMRVGGKFFANDSINVMGDLVVGNNPVWFRFKHPGNVVAAGNAVNALMRIETNDVNALPWWYNVLRLRMSASVVAGSYLSQEIGYNSNLFNTTYLRFAYRIINSPENWFEIFNYGATGTHKFYTEGAIQFNGQEATARTPSAQVEIISTTKGFLQPRMTAVQRAAISSPATGLSTYDTDSLKNATFNGTAWKFPLYTTDVPVLDGGSVTPTSTNSTNVDASTPYEIHYTRVGNSVTFAGAVDIDATATGTAIIELTPPIASAFTSSTNAYGTIAEGSAPNSTTGWINASAANDRLILTVTATTTGSRTYFFTGTMKVL